MPIRCLPAEISIPTWGLQSAGKLKDAPFPVGVQEDRQYHASPAIGRAGWFLPNNVKDLKFNRMLEHLSIENSPV
jgi:hypothetical protein